MAVRNFDGVDDTIVWSTGAVSAMTFGTFAVITKLDVVVSLFPGWQGLHDSGGTGTVLLHHDEFGPSLHVPGTGSNVWTGGALSTGTWYLVVARKPTGTATGRYSVYNFTSTAWSHSDGNPPSLPNWTAPGASGTVKNNFNTGNFLDGQMAASGLWANTLPWSADGSGDTALIAAGLHTSAQNWVTASPSAFWLFNQDPLSNVDDIVGAADQTSVTGTTVVTGSDPAGFDFTLASEPGPNLRMTRSSLQLR